MRVRQRHFVPPALRSCDSSAGIRPNSRCCRWGQVSAIVASVTPVGQEAAPAAPFVMIGALQLVLALAAPAVRWRVAAPARQPD